VSDSARLKVVPSVDSDWGSSHHEVVIGKDILELLSTSMYVDPMTVYREYVQNATDSIDQARTEGKLSPSGGQVQISVDSTLRAIRIRDDGTSLPWAEFLQRLSNLGASRKRGTPTRGFRGVGRLAGLGYCQELIFRGRVEGEDLISELRWDGRMLKAMLRAPDHSKNLRALVKDVVSVRRVKAKDEPRRFFEVELSGIIRHRDDRLLSEAAVGEYLSQVAPVPFSPDFALGREITAALKPHVQLGNVAIYINNAAEPVYRPHLDSIKVDGKIEARFNALEILELSGVDGGIAAIGWVLHHDYNGALSNSTLVKGLRLRSGNIQVGDNAILESLFPESRFNGWAVGEIHVVDPKILANGKRHNFEHSINLDNVLNQTAPTAREIARRCRQSSISRKWEREFDLHKEAALERAKIVSRGGITRATRQIETDAALKSIKSMKKVLETRHLDEDVRKSLTGKAETAEARVQKLLGEGAALSDPLDALPSPKKTAYRHIISLIYECSANRVAASALVDRILSRLSDEVAPKPKALASGKPKATHGPKHRGQK